jgi:flagellin
MVINTNIEALVTANNLNASSMRLAKSLARLSSGSKITAPSDDAAGLAVSSRLKAQITRLDAAVTNVINAVSFTQTQDGFLKTIDNAFRRMGELALLSMDETKADSDRVLYNAEFAQLVDYVNVTKGKSFNEHALFDGESLDVTVDSNGNTFALSGIDLNSVTYAEATSTSASFAITSSSLAYAALNKVKTVIDQIAKDRSTLGALQTRLNFTSEQLLVTKENLSSAVSRISDVDVAVEATEFARSQILVQSGTTMLAQANSLPNSALRLLQQ